MFNQKSVGKRLPDDQNDEHPNKCHKNESLDELIEPINITEVNDDCLEHILKKLDPHDLLNVANTSKPLLKAARLAYVSKYGKKRVDVQPRFNRSRIICHEDAILIFDFSSGLKFMRCFGQSISELSICLSFISEHQRNELDRYLDKYCAASVIDLKYSGITEKNMTDQFPKVKTLEFGDPNFQFGREDIHTRFQNVRVLSLGWFDNGSRVDHFPHLERLEVHAVENAVKKLTNFLRMNQQLRSLRMSGRFDLNCLQAASECPQLESLWLTAALIAAKKPVQMHFKSVKKFEIDGNSLQRLTASNVSIVFDQLEELKIEEYLFHNPIDFISAHPSVSKITLPWISVDWPIPRLVKALPSLTDVRYNHRLSLDEAVNFTNECKLLKRLSFYLCNRTDYDELQKQLGNEWKSSIEYDRVKLERHIF